MQEIIEGFFLKLVQHGFVGRILRTERRVYWHWLICVQANSMVMAATA